MTLTTNREERVAVGTTLCVGDRPLDGRVGARRTRAGGSCISRGSTIAARPRRSPARSACRLPLGRVPDGELWVHELVGAEVVDRAGAATARSRRSRPTPRTTSRARAAALVPIVFVVEHATAASSSTCPTGCSTDRGDDAHRPLHDLPRVRRGAAERVAAGQARAARPARRARARPARRTRRPAPHRRRHAVRRRRRHGDDARAALRRRRGGRSRRGRCSCFAPAGRRFDQAWREELAGGDGFSLLCGRYEGVDQRVAEHLSTASSRSATTCSRAARPPRSW